MSDLVCSRVCVRRQNALQSTAFFTLVRLWAARRRERLALCQLDARMLRDIGAGGAEAAREAAKPFWSA